MRGVFHPPSWLNRGGSGSSGYVNITFIGGGGGGAGGGSAMYGNGGGGSGVSIGCVGVGSSHVISGNIIHGVKVIPGQAFNITVAPPPPSPPLLAIGEWTKRTSRWPWSKEETTQVDVNSIKDLRELLQ